MRPASPDSRWTEEEAAPSAGIQGAGIPAEEERWLPKHSVTGTTTPVTVHSEAAQERG